MRSSTTFQCLAQLLTTSAFEDQEVMVAVKETAAKEMVVAKETAVREALVLREETLVVQETLMVMETPMAKRTLVAKEAVPKTDWFSHTRSKGNTWDDNQHAHQHFAPAYSKTCIEPRIQPP